MDKGPNISQMEFFMTGIYCQSHFQVSSLINGLRKLFCLFQTILANLVSFHTVKTNPNF